MTDEQIRTKISKLATKITTLRQTIDIALLQIQHIMDVCPHRHKKQWTNNDGAGQFIVERCDVCGKQRDGGLK